MSETFLDRLQDLDPELVEGGDSAFDDADFEDDETDDE